MPVADGKINLNNGGAGIEIRTPLFGYETRIKFPFDFDNTRERTAFDHGKGAATYDIRSCECDFILDADEAQFFNNFVKNTSANQARGQTALLSMLSGSKFFPFGADKGDVGNFTVTIEMARPQGVGKEPFRYFKCNVKFTNVGAWPAFTPASPESQGEFSIGTVAGLRMPRNWFSPDVMYNVKTFITEGGAQTFMDAGANGDNYFTKFDMMEKEGNMASLISFLASASGRVTQFAISANANSYPFGRDKSSGLSFNVRLMQAELRIVHASYNIFETGLNLRFIS